MDYKDMSNFKKLDEPEARSPDSLVLPAKERSYSALPKGSKTVSIQTLRYSQMAARAVVWACFLVVLAFIVYLLISAFTGN